MSYLILELWQLVLASCIQSQYLTHPEGDLVTGRVLL